MTMWRRLRSLGGPREPVAAAPEPDRGPGIGERLRARRRDRGLSFEDVERDTRINPLYLDALEREDWAAMPAPVYARGFMRSYARYLGMDPDAAVAAVPHDLPRPLGLEPLPSLRRSGGGGPLLPPVNPRTAAAAAVALVVLVLAAVVVLPRLRGGGTPAAPPPAATVAPTGVAGAPATGPTVPPFTAGTVPDFTGVDRVTAVALLDQLKLQAVPIEATNASVAAGVVFDQSPAPGTAVQENDVVTLFVSKGSGN